MQQDQFSQMEHLVRDIVNLLQQLASKIGSLLVLGLQKLREQQEKVSELEDKLAHLKYSAEVKISALHERLEEYESSAHWNGEDIQSWADYRDRSEEEE